MGRIQKQSGPVILLDAGHGGDYRGASWNEIDEADVNLQVARLTHELLFGLKCVPTLTRDHDVQCAHKNRLKMALCSDVVVSFHCHSDKNEAKDAPETWSRATDPEATELARLIRMNLESKMGLKATWRHTHKIKLVTGVKAGVVVVTGYLSNPETAKRIKTGEHQRDAAESVFQALTSFYCL